MTLARFVWQAVLRNAALVLGILLIGTAGGALIAWMWINLSASPGTVILSQEEAEGPQFSDPATLDIIVAFKRDRVCPAVTQRWVWRWTTYQGERIQQAIPIEATATPFLADGAKVMLTLPNPGVPDLNDQWFYRTVTTESCGFLPASMSTLFGTRIYRSPDTPASFVGAPHGR